MKKKDIAMKMINGKSFPKQKGKASLNKPVGEKNMGEKMYLGKDEHNRA